MFRMRGSYAPVTVLVDERADGVHLSYDRMASFLAPYGNRDALEVAEGSGQKNRKSIARSRSVSTLDITAKFEAGLNEVKNSVGMNHTLRNLSLVESSLVLKA